MKIGYFLACEPFEIVSRDVNGLAGCQIHQSRAKRFHAIGRNKLRH